MISIPPERIASAKSIAALLKPVLRLALTTHVNADGDGVGSEIALWHLLKARGMQPAIANATGIPERFGFLVPDGADQSERAGKDLAGAVRERRVPVICIDHHVSPGTLPEGPRLVAPEATATAELVFDLATALEGETRADAHRAVRLAAGWVERGLDPESIYESV